MNVPIVIFGIIGIGGIKMNKWMRKLLCKLRFHDDNLSQIIIQPVFKYDDDEIFLPKRNGWMWKCIYCTREIIERQK